LVSIISDFQFHYEMNGISLVHCSKHVEYGELKFISVLNNCAKL